VPLGPDLIDLGICVMMSVLLVPPAPQIVDPLTDPRAGSQGLPAPNSRPDCTCSTALRHIVQSRRASSKSKTVGACYKEHQSLRLYIFHSCDRLFGVLDEWGSEHLKLPASVWSHHAITTTVSQMQLATHRSATDAALRWSFRRRVKYNWRLAKFIVGYTPSRG
jgi:hypothetical protein